MRNHEDVPVDLIAELGNLAFGTRLRRLTERTMRDISRVYASMRVEFEARWFPVLYLLGRHSPLSVTEIARALGLTHPAINQVTGALASKGLVSSQKDKTDERRRLVELTPKGRETIRLLTPVWDTIASATEDLLREAGGDFLEQIGRLERALDDEDMYQRVSGRVKRDQAERVEIIDYEPHLKKQFESLNTEWLERYFEVEPPDRALLSDPNGKILKSGGAILFARLDGEIVGTVALLRDDPETLELAKMAVTESAQGRQVGRCLLQAAIARAGKLGARRIILRTSPRLKAADSLYRSVGFRSFKPDSPPETEYRRETYMMVLDLQKQPSRKERKEVVR